MKIISVKNREQYLQNPCRISSIPYWKALSLSVPEDMKIVHHDEFDESILEQYTDEPYFRLLHDLREFVPAPIPEGFVLCAASLGEYADHINACYGQIGMTAEELKGYTERAVYSPELWLAVKDVRTGQIAATGIGELDRDIHEGILEWIQVSADFRGLGLGHYIVTEQLRRMSKAAEFATVSGKVNNPANPEALYRSCGFTGNDVWHVLQRRQRY